MKIFFILLLIVLLPVISACSRDDSSYSIDIYDKDVSGYKLSESLLKYFTIQDIKKMVLFCALGLRSALATKTLTDMGFKNVAHVDGGFDALKKSGFDIIEKIKK